MGTQESPIFSKLKKRFCSGRKTFSEHGANRLEKIYVLKEKFNMEEIDRSVEEWIKEIEEKVKKNKRRKDSYRATEREKEGIGVHIAHTE